MLRYILFASTLGLILIFGLGCGEREEAVNNTESSGKEAQNDRVELNNNVLLPIENKKDQASIDWQYVENGKYLPAPYYYQKDVPVFGDFACGPAALKIVLEYKKQTGEIEEEIPPIDGLIEMAGIRSDVWSDSNIDNYFIEGFGITDVALKKLSSDFDIGRPKIFGLTFYPDFPPSKAVDPAHRDEIIESEGWRAQIDEEGWDMEKLHQTVNEGDPVIVDVTVDMDPLEGPNDPKSYAPFYTQDGQVHWELAFGQGHFMVAIGFEDWGGEDPKIILLDPLRERNDTDNLSIYSLEDFERSWELLNNQGFFF